MSLCSLIRFVLKEFGKYLRGKSIDKLLHRARKHSLKRIIASEGEIKTTHKKSAPKRVGAKGQAISRFSFKNTARH